ncbi:cytochrome P450 [Campylobacter jejuni]|uniref:Cytochrome P450 n=2 Tax=Campylobacter TaxID=194 RepID=A0A689Z5C1_CAMCO|nr:MULTISPECIES: cytochrome P450 [Campylobacter]EAH5902180.1 cytochrome P450 [Campylobacter coli]EFV07367.1 cytochrome P450 family protein [Campylobacter jejuni subsp. jejuni DFVF1099]AJA55631.1 Pentalenene oxygenase [Campylobacter jejuni subsp. jejuni]AJK83415.1 cytochrome P450 [Campylobacter jejuni subsp. jejuni]AJK85301.1 cytochrome P450 [Campylobacter jejuni subsp. jejuni]
MSECPFFPKPYKNKASTLLTFLLKRRSWLDGLYERSYKMQTGYVKMPNFDLYVINDTKEVKRMMVDEVREFPKSAFLHELLSPLLGESIFTTNGEVWKKQRELLRPSFEMTRINKVFNLMSEAVADMMDRFSKYPNHAIIEVDEAMTFITADVIFRTIMSSKLDEEKGKKILNAFVTFQEQSVHTAMRRMFRFPKWLSYVLGDRKRAKAGDVIRQVLSDIIKPRYDMADNAEFEDILGSLLLVVDADTNKRFSFEEILDQVAMLFLAGHETTASSLTWTLYLLSLYPKEQEKAYEEITQVLQGGAIEISHLRQFKYLTNIFKESLRLYPPVGFFAREAKKDTQVRDKLIKKDSGVVIAPWLIHRHEEFWTNPHGFNPSRFEGEYKKDAYLPFGVGERICIGQGFAMQEAILILANILKTYKLELEEGFVPDVVGRLTVRSANGMRIKFSKREL